MRVATRRAPGTRLQRLAVLGSETLLTATGGPTLRLPCRPDRTAARRLAAGHRLGWVRLHVDGDQATAELYASTRRPVRTRIPLAAALGLADAGVPTLVVRVAP